MMEVETLHRVKVAYQTEYQGDMLVTWYDFDTKPCDAKIRKVVDRMKAKPGVHRIISVQRHKIEVENYWI